MSEFDIGTPVWYYRHDLPNRTQPRAAQITGYGSNPSSFDVQVYMSHTLDVHKGSPPLMSRPSVPFRLSFPEDGTFPFEAFVCPVGVRWSPKPQPSPVSQIPTPPPQTVTPPAQPAPDTNAAMSKLMSHPAWDRAFEEFKGTVSESVGVLKIASTKGQLLAQFTFGTKGYTLKVFKDAETFGDFAQPSNDPKQVRALIIEAGKVAVAAQDAASAKDAVVLQTA